MTFFWHLTPPFYQPLRRGHCWSAHPHLSQTSGLQYEFRRLSREIHSSELVVAIQELQLVFGLQSSLIFFFGSKQSTL